MIRNCHRSVIALLGAGASYDLGLPLAREMAQMVCEMMSPVNVFSFANHRCSDLIGADRVAPSGISALCYWYNRDLRDDSEFCHALGLETNAGSFVHDLYHRIANINGGVVDIEKLGAAIDFAAALTKADLALFSYPAALKGRQPTLAEIAKLVRESVRKLTWLPAGHEEKSDALWGVLKFVIGSSNPTVVTLNYDNGVELCLGMRHVDWQYGFVSGYSDTQRLSFKQLSGRSLQRCALLKLHGSSNWTVDADGMVSIIDPIALERQFKPREAIKEPAAILFGGGVKMRYRGPFMALHCEFRRRLEMHRCVVAVGYSFRDDHVNDDIGAWARRSPKRLIIAIDPGDFYDKQGTKRDLGDILNVPETQVVHLKHGLKQSTSDLSELLGCNVGP